MSVALLLVALRAQPAAAQSDSQEKVYTYVEQMPAFPGGGGQPAIMAAIQERVVYPELARREKITGRVFVSFIIAETGKVKDIKVVKGIGAGCDEAAVAAVSQLPLLVPGKQNGRVVAVSLTVPILFQEGSPATPLANRVFTYVEQMPSLPGQPKTPDTIVEVVGGSYGVALSPCRKPWGKTWCCPPKCSTAAPKASCTRPSW